MLAPRPRPVFFRLTAARELLCDTRTTSSGMSPPATPTCRGFHSTRMYGRMAERQMRSACVMVDLVVLEVESVTVRAVAGDGPGRALNHYATRQLHPAAHRTIRPHDPLHRPPFARSQAPACHPLRVRPVHHLGALHIASSLPGSSLTRPAGGNDPCTITRADPCSSSKWSANAAPATGQPRASALQGSVRRLQGALRPARSRAVRRPALGRQEPGPRLQRGLDRITHCRPGAPARGVEARHPRERRGEDIAGINARSLQIRPYQFSERSADTGVYPREAAGEGYIQRESFTA